MIFDLIAEIQSITVLNVINIIFGRYKTTCSVAYSIGVLQCLEMKYYDDHFTIRNIVESLLFVPLVLIGLFKHKKLIS